MINHDLLSLLEKVLGKGKKTSGANYTFFSPFISHYKPKLEINLEASKTGEYYWHCWVSDAKGRSIHSLFKKLKLGKSYFEELNRVVKIEGLYAYTKAESKYDSLELPEEFTRLVDVSTIKDISTKFQLKQAILYLKNRGLLSTDILRYNIGYCPSGKYAGRVVIPSYDADFKLNYFVTRTIFDDVGLSYKNPKVNKDVVGFESMINWDEPITIVEGVFDAISVRYNAIPLFGKTMLPLLKERIVIRKPPMVYVALDNDAMRDSIRLCDYLIGNGINTSLIKMTGKDANELGFEGFVETLTHTHQTTQLDLIKERIMI